MGETFDRYAAEHLAALFRFAVTLTDDRGLAEDIVQEVLIRVHRQWGKIGALPKRDLYVRRMLVNEFLSWRRRWSRILPFADVSPAPADAPDFAERNAARESLRTELAKLPRRQLTAVVLRHYCDMTDLEIADSMGCRPVTVRGYISRGLKSLRVELGSPAYTEDAETIPAQLEGR